MARPISIAASDQGWICALNELKTAEFVSLEPLDRMLRNAGFLCVALVAAVLTAPARAGQLSETAKPMTSEAVIAMYSGKTLVGSQSDIYFAADHTDKGILGKPKMTTLLLGTWSVADNEICTYNFRKNDRQSYRDCFKHWQDGGRIVTLWSAHADGSPVDANNGYSSDGQKLVAGDLVSERFAAAGGM
jgi:Protein of unknown function (DUF995)